MRPSTSTTTGRLPAISSASVRHTRLASGSRPGGDRDHAAGGSSALGRRHRLAQQPAAIAAQVEHDPGGGCAPATACASSRASRSPVSRLKPVMRISSRSPSICAKTVSGGTIMRTISAPCARGRRGRASRQSRWCSSGPAISVADRVDAAAVRRLRRRPSGCGRRPQPGQRAGPSAITATTDRAAARRPRARPRPALPERRSRSSAAAPGGT